MIDREPIRELFGQISHQILSGAKKSEGLWYRYLANCFLIKIVYFWTKLPFMPSPFPGMEPYLEGHLWPDVHSSLSYLITVQLTPRLPAGYLVQMSNYKVEDTSPEEDVGIMYPDVEVFRKAGAVKDCDVGSRIF